MIVLTASGGIDTVVQAMQAGAQDFLVKPAAPERINRLPAQRPEMGELTAEVDRLKKRATGTTTFAELIGASRAMGHVKKLGERAAPLQPFLSSSPARAGSARS